MLNKSDASQYLNITEIYGLEMSSLSMLRYVNEECEKGSSDCGDVLDAIVIAIAMLERHCKHLKWAKTVFVLSDFGLEIDQDDSSKIIGKAVDYGVKINIIGFGFKDDPPPDSDKSLRASNEHFMRSVSADTAGDVFSGSEALSLLAGLRSRPVKATTLIRCSMTLGDPFENIDAALSFPVWAYAKVKEAKLPSAKKWSRVGAEAVDVADESSKGEVIMERTYKLKDLKTEDIEADNIADTVELDKEDLIRAYKYGKDLIPFAEEDRDAMKLKTTKGFSILGFIRKGEVSRELFINDPMQIIPDPTAGGDSKSMFEVLTLSLQAKEVYALVRYVRIDNAAPKLGVLIPHIGKRIWCAWLQLPFKEDVREYSFTTLAPLLLDPGNSTQSQSQTFRESSSASLAVSTLNSAGIKGSGEAKRRKLNYRNVDSAEADSRIDKFMDDMDLMNAIDDDGDLMEAYKPSDIFNPGYQRIYQCIAHRAMHPSDKELPELDPRFVAGVLPMPEIIERAKASFDSLKAAFNITKIEIDKEDNRKRFKRGVDNAIDIEREVISAAAAQAQNLSGGVGTTNETTFSLVSDSVITSVGTAEPVADFKAIVVRARTSATANVLISAAMNQLASRVVSFVQESMGSQFYEKAVACMAALREESVAAEQPKRFNDLLGELKTLCEEGGNERCKAFWGVMKTAAVSSRLGLITKDEVEQSEFTKSGAEEFFSSDGASLSLAPEVVEEVDEQDLLDMLD